MAAPCDGRASASSHRWDQTQRPEVTQARSLSTGQWKFPEALFHCDASGQLRVRWTLAGDLGAPCHLDVPETQMVTSTPKLPAALGKLRFSTDLPHLDLPPVHPNLCHSPPLPSRWAIKYPTFRCYYRRINRSAGRYVFSKYFQHSLY